MICAPVGRDALRAAPVSLSLLQVIGRRVLMGSFTDSRKAALTAKVIILWEPLCFGRTHRFPPLLFVPVTQHTDGIQHRRLNSF